MGKSSASVRSSYSRSSKLSKSSKKEKKEKKKSTSEDLFNSSSASVGALPKQVVFDEAQHRRRRGKDCNNDDNVNNLVNNSSISSLQFPQHVEVEERNRGNSSYSRFHNSSSSRVSFAASVLTCDDAEPAQDENRIAFGKLVTQTLWNPDPSVVRSALREFTRVLLRSNQEGEEEEDEEEDDLDARHEALLLGGHLSLIRVLQTHLQHSEILVEALQALLLMFEDVNVYWLGVLGAMGAMEAVVSTMTVKAKDLLVQEHVYRLLLLLLRVKENAIKFFELDGVAAVFRRLESYPQDRETSLDVCSVIKKLCEWEHTRTLLVSSGAVSTLAGVIDRCSSSDGSSVTSATTVTTYTEEDGKSVGNNRVDVGSVTSTVFQDPAVQTSAYDTMVALVAPRAFRDSNRSRKLTRVKGGLYEPQERHRSSRSKSAYAYCDTVPEQDEEGEASAPPPPPYQSFSSMIIRDLWSDCDEVLLAALNDITETLSKSKHVYGKAFIEVGGPLAVTKVMEARRRSGAVQEGGCEILRTLVALEGFPTILGEVGGLETLLEGIRDGEDDKFKKGAVKALATMIKGSASNTQRFFASGGVQILIQSMNRHVDNASLQEESCKILRLCCEDRSYKTAIFKSGGASAIARILETQDDPKALKAAKKAMKVLIHDD